MLKMKAMKILYLLFIFLKIFFLLKDISFKVEAVSVGRVIGARLRFEPNQVGEQIVDGLLAIQGLFQKQGLWPLVSNSEFLCGRILVRESYHTPYR